MIVTLLVCKGFQWRPVLPGDPQQQQHIIFMCADFADKTRKQTSSHQSKIEKNVQLFSAGNFLE